MWRGMLLAKFSRDPNSAASTSMVLGRCVAANDRACWSYVPSLTPVRSRIFVPSTQYRIFNKPDLKWDRLAQGGQEVIVLPVNPASMLVEPFVEHLGGALRRSMDAAMSAVMLAIQESRS